MYSYIPRTRYAGRSKPFIINTPCHPIKSFNEYSEYLCLSDCSNLLISFFAWISIHNIGSW